MTSLNVSKTDLFGKLVKKLSKRYKNIEYDIDTFLESIQTKQDLGIHLGKDLYKVRIKNTDNNKGKNAGYRLITYFKIENNSLVLVYIYSKSDIDNIDENTLDQLVIDQI